MKTNCISRAASNCQLPTPRSGNYSFVRCPAPETIFNASYLAVWPDLLWSCLFFFFGLINSTAPPTAVLFGRARGTDVSYETSS